MNQVNDVTKYGEMIPSMYVWNTFEHQKKRSKFLERVGNSSSK